MLLSEERQENLTLFLPAECDMRMRSTWFDCEDNEDTIKEVDELMGIYEMSVGRGANLLLNIGPDARGLLPGKDAQRLAEFGEAIRRRYGTPLNFAYTGKGAHAEIVAPKQQLVDRVMIQEDLTCGEGVQAFRVYADLPGGLGRICLYKGDTIGHKAICVFPTFKTDRIVVETEGADGRTLTNLQAFYAQ
jgi:alpha-L-fucosidase